MELLPLDDYNRKASLGFDYPELDQTYEDWSRDLHMKGNYIDNERLILMSKNGLIRWYCKQFAHFDIDYNFNHIKYYINNLKKLTFNELKKIHSFGKFFGINNGFIEALELKKHTYKYNYLFSKYRSPICCPNPENKRKLNKYCTCTFGVYLIDNIGEENLKQYLIDVYTEYLKYKDFFDNQTLFNTFLEKYPKILEWGIIYHKFKVILEKISCARHPDIYKVDRFVDTVQRYIFTLVANYFQNIVLNHNIDIYIKDEEKLNNDRLLISYPDENLNQPFDFI